MKNLISKLVILSLFITVLGSCSSPSVIRTPANEEELRTAKSALMAKYQKSTEALTLSVDWVQSNRLSSTLESLGSDTQNRVVLLYGGDRHNGKYAYFSYNRLIQAYIERAKTMEQIEALDAFLDSVETRLRTGQIDKVGPDRLLYDLTPRQRNTQYSFGADENFSDPSASSRDISKSHESDRLAHMMAAYMNLITSNEEGPERFQRVFTKLKGLEAIKEYNHFSGSSSASASYWVWSKFDLHAMVDSIHQMAKDKAAFNYVLDLLEVLPLNKVMMSSRYFDSPWKVVPALDSTAKRQAYGILYYHLIDQYPLKEKFGGIGEDWIIQSSNAPELMRNRKLNLDQAMKNINFDYFDSAEKVEELVKSLEAFKSSDELAFHWKVISQGNGPKERAANLVKAKLRRLGMVSEVSHSYVLLPIQINGAYSYRKQYANISQGRFPEAWTIEFNNRYHESSAKFYIHETKAFFDNYVDSLGNRFQLEGMSKLLDKLEGTKYRVSHGYGGQDVKVLPYLFHEVSTPVADVKANWLSYIVFGLGSRVDYGKQAEAADQLFRLVYFEQRVIQSISTQEDLDAYVKLSKLFSLELNMDKSNKLWTYLFTNTEANPRHLLYIMEKWDEFAKAEKIELSPEIFAKLKKPTPLSVAAAPPFPIEAAGEKLPKVKAKPESCTGWMKAFFSFK